MITINFKEIVDQLPIILEYFVSGFIFMMIFQFMTTRKTHNKSYHTVWCIIVSFIIKNILTIIHSFIFNNFRFSFAWKVIISVVFASILSILFAYVTEWKCFNKIILLISHKSIHDDIWRDIIDYDKGTTMIIYCNNETISYTGVFVAYEEKGLDSWFVLEEYIVQTDNTKCVSDEDNNPTRMAINIKNVDRVELYYSSDTKIFKKHLSNNAKKNNLNYVKFKH